jgi:site-specific DNA-methyltransferase (adenine-specific)
MQLFYGDNLEILRKYIRDESVDLCYIDPPFNSNRNYNQIYNNLGKEDKAQSQAFSDTWEWGKEAESGYDEITTNEKQLYSPRTIDLIIGLRKVIERGSLLAYLISMTLRIVEIYRVLKSTGSFYLHCDPTVSHYLKLVLDAVFCSQGGQFLNEIIWCYNIGGRSKRHFAKKHDVIFWYAKGDRYFFDGAAAGLKRETGTKSFGGKIGVDENGRPYQDKFVKSSMKYYRYFLDEPKIPEDWWVGINSIQSQSEERLGYPTQKPEALLERIIKTSCEDDGVVLDAFCGCGTTVAVAQRLNRQWIGIDITYQSIALILKRLEDSYGKDILDTIELTGVPKDKESATALAHKTDDRTRKEFEKWAILTYSNNRAIVNEKKGKDSGIDGRAYIFRGKEILFSVKSGKVHVGMIRDLRGTIERENAAAGFFITLEHPTKDMLKEAAVAGIYKDEYMEVERIKIVTVDEIIAGARLPVILVREVLKEAQSKGAEQMKLV